MNEEEIKIKYVLPWLVGAGVDLEDLQLEQSFSIRIGRQNILVGESSKRGKAGARLDILVRRGDKNLLIVETKAPDLSLTDDDRDQAISYARLVHPIAPYAVVTNGSEYRLYDSITKKRIEPSDIEIRGFVAALPEKDLVEAQTLFLALSKKNLARFCQSQVAGELRLIKGTVFEDRKYIPELHVQREAVHKEVEEFYRSDSPGLLLVGQSGLGKTCELCWIAESLILSGKPVLFFNGFSLENGLLEAISKEFLWEFGGVDVPIQAVKRIESFVHEDFLTIIVDAIDEWTFESRSNHLASFLCAAEKRKIKVILSAKKSAVDQFLSHRGNPTATSLLTKQIYIEPFSVKEFFHAVEKYRRAYQFFGSFEDTVLDQARSNPFLLRVLFDVARKSSIKHLTFSSPEFFDAYYERALCKTSDIRQASETLKAIARFLYERNKDWIPEGDVRESLGLRVNEHLMEELFEYGILLRSLGDAGESAIGFYFQQLRDYIISFRALQFNKMTAQSLMEEFKNVNFPCMRGDVFTLYYRLARKEHKILFDGEFRANAEKYLNYYVSLIKGHFPALKTALKPHTEGRVGFIGELRLSQRRVGGYGFRPVRNKEDEVYFVPVEKGLGESNLAYLNGADEMHLRSCACGFTDDIDIAAEVVEGELLPQIRGIVEQGRLNDSNNPDMLSELIIETVLHNKNIFQQVIKSDQKTVRYPLDLDAVLNCLLREKLSRYYQEEIIARKRRNREIREEWRGSLVTYSYQPTPSDSAEISQKVERALSVGEIPIFTTRYRPIEVLEDILAPAVTALRKNQIEITAPLFKRNGQLGLAGDVPVAPEDLKAYLGELYSAFLLNYKLIVDTNFPTLREYFGLYSKLPVSIYLVLGEAVERRFGKLSTSLSIYFVKSDLDHSAVQVVDEVICERSEGDMHFVVDGVVHEGICGAHNAVENLFGSPWGLVREQFHGMTLRKLVYSTLRQELSDVEQAFRKRLMLDRPPCSS